MTLCSSKILACMPGTDGQCLRDWDMIKHTKHHSPNLIFLWQLRKQAGTAAPGAEPGEHALCAPVQVQLRMASGGEDAD